MTDHTELRALAEVATPGPWLLDNHFRGVFTEGRLSRTLWVVAKAFRAEDEAFIAAANPAAMLDLLDELDDLRARLAAVEELHREHVCPSGIAALRECFIVHGGNCANVGTCVECQKAYPCPDVKAVRGESL